MNWMLWIRASPPTATWHLQFYWVSVSYAAVGFPTNFTWFRFLIKPHYVWCLFKMSAHSKRFEFKQNSTVLISSTQTTCGLPSKISNRVNNIRISQPSFPLINIFFPLFIFLHRMEDENGEKTPFAVAMACPANGFVLHFVRRRQAKPTSAKFLLRNIYLLFGRISISVRLRICDKDSIIHRQGMKIKMNVGKHRRHPTNHTVVVPPPMANPMNAFDFDKGRENADQKGMGDSKANKKNGIVTSVSFQPRKSNKWNCAMCVHAIVIWQNSKIVGITQSGEFEKKFIIIASHSNACDMMIHVIEMGMCF